MAESATPKESSAPLPIPESVHAKRWWILTVLCISLVLVIAANAGLNVGLPSLARQLGASQTELQWLVDIFVMVFAGLLMPMGALGDRYGRKRALLTGLAIYGLMSFVTLFATSVAHVMMVRGLMGLGAALIMPATLSLITTAFVGKERTLAIAIWSGCAGAGAGIGLLTSGALLLYFDWNAIFLINVPLSLLSLVMGAYFLVEAKDPQARPIDWIGSVLIVLALLALLYSIIEMPLLGYFHPQIVGAGLTAVVLFGLFAMRARRIANPLVDIEWFCDRRFSMGAFAIALLFFALMGWFFLGTQLFQYVLGLSPLGAALAAVSLSFTQVIFARHAAFWVERCGTRNTVILGMVLVVTGLVIATFFVQPDSPLWPLIVAQILIGLGLPWASSPATSVVLDSLPPSRIGAGSAVNSTVREIGAALGIAVLGSISTAVYRAQVPVEGLSAESAAIAKTSLPAAISVANELPDPAAFIHSAQVAFGHAFQTALYASVVILVLAIGLVYGVGFIPRPSEESSNV